jgi:UDP-glucose 4-epimerase
LYEQGVNVIATVRAQPERIREQLSVPVEVFDVLNPETNTLDAALECLPVDCLIHSATANDIVSRIPSQGMDLSVNGTWNVLEWARNRGIRRVIFFSTFQVYGTELEGLVDEDRPVKCESAYGLNHWFGEEVCKLFAKKYGMAIAVVRPSNVYGAPTVSTVQRETLVPTCFVRSALERGEIVLQSSGKQLRNFISTSEVAKGCTHLLSNFPADFQVYNLCSAYSASIIQIANITAEVYAENTGTRIPIRVQSALPSEGNQFQARSRLENLWDSEEESADRMRWEIAQVMKRMLNEISVAS